MEKLGLATATICSSEFTGLGQMEATAMGMPGLPIVRVPHPVGLLPEVEVRAIAEEAFDEVVRSLTISAGKLVEGYRGKYLEADKTIRAKTLFA